MFGNFSIFISEHKDFIFVYCDGSLFIVMDLCMSFVTEIPMMNQEAHGATQLTLDLGGNTVPFLIVGVSRLNFNIYLGSALIIQKL